MWVVVDLFRSRKSLANSRYSLRILSLRADGEKQRYSAHTEIRVGCMRRLQHHAIKTGAWFDGLPNRLHGPSRVCCNHITRSPRRPALAIAVARRGQAPWRFSG